MTKLTTEKVTDLQAQLQAVLSAPSMQTHLRQQDAALQATRRELLAELMAVPQSFARLQAESAAALAAAQARVKAAQAELDAAVTTEGNAMSASLSSSHRRVAAENALRQRLTETADVRLKEFADLLMRLVVGPVRSAFTARPVVDVRETVGGRVRSERIVSNAAVVAAAASEVEAAASEALARQLVPATRAETEAWLRGACMRVAGAVAPLGVPSPTFADDGQLQIKLVPLAAG